ncbi:hypothetical protein [Winogradskyella jejuensis]|uniref:Uncharacterized protein n=1 Tax=Winogradskyella jejuensis TaxID=1089305 RepID=A0A1M5RWW6_9FLAO|nr:hypothetical protein [Winogradskyella jejuensis]SHH30714.1 hypothetical protein SAMN05444148_1708 [Winogradskyella jejuensis]
MGIVQQSQNPKANQEVVLQFEEQLTDTEAQQSLEEISISLEKIGVDGITITSDNGLYRISYYSKSAAKNIKELLSETVGISLSDSSDSSEKESRKFDFDVLKIEPATSNSWDFEAQEVPIVNLKSDRSFNPDVFKFPVLVEAGKITFDLKVAYNANRQVVFVSDNTSHNIPEVRAGPLA